MPTVIPPNTPVFRATDPARIGLTTGRERTQAGIQYLEVRWGQGGANREFVAQQHLRVLSDEPDKPFGRVEDLRLHLTFEKLRGTLNDFLYSMDAAQIDFLPYQFRPVFKFIDSPTERLLLADEVGLGKTIEAALIWLELKARREAKRLLVVCPNMIATKWRRELRDKFGIPAEFGTVHQLLRARDDFVRQGERASFAWICSYSGLRPSRRELPHLADDEAELSHKGAFARSCLRWDEHFDSPLFDLVIFDEAHYMRNSQSASSRLGAVLSNAAQSVLCVSATPINNASKDLFTLLRLVDPDFFADPAIFPALLAENRPAVDVLRALRKLPHADTKSARQCLEELRSSPFVGKTELLQRMISALGQLNSGDRPGLLRAQELAEGLNILGAYVARTRRVHVQPHSTQRKVMVLPVEFTSEERAFYQAVTRMVRQKITASRSAFAAFHLVMPQQRMASCIPATVEAFRNGDFGNSDEILHESFDLNPESFDEDDEEVPDIEPALTELLNHDFEAHDTKYAALLDILKKLRGDKAILFAFFKSTLFYLNRRLQASGIPCALIHGGISEQAEREQEIERFRDDPSVRVLLSSEVGSEGIDLQFCSAVINYDLPWNPMKVAQRIGRIDRVGQASPVLRIIHFKVRDTIEERLFERLHEKLFLAEAALGDMEAILGEEIQRLTIDLLSSELNSDQEIERIELTQRALEAQRLALARLENEGAQLIAHGDYIADKVDRNRTLGRYLSADELRHYIDHFFRNRFDGCRLDWDSPELGMFHLDLTFQAHEALKQFAAERRMDVPPEHLAKTFRATLSPEIARRPKPRRHGSLVLINHLSPLVRWITNEWAREGGFYDTAAVRLRTAEFEPGVYVYRIERWHMNGLRGRQSLEYAVGSLRNGECLPTDQGERLVSLLIRKGDSWFEASTLCSKDKIMALWERLGHDLRMRLDTAWGDFRARNENLLAIQQAQVQRHFCRRRRLDTLRLETLKAKGRSPRLIYAVQSKIEKDTQKEQQRLADLTRKAAGGFQPHEIAWGVALIEP